MSIRIQSIQAPIAHEMQLFEEKFREYMRSQVFLLDKITAYIVKRKGKQMRPMFVFLVHKALNGGRLDEKAFRGAALIELLHTATLVHDDVVDDANMRRGFFSINALWKNKIAVLVGDYLLSRGLLLSVDHGDFEILKLVSRAVKEMSEGELLQIEKARMLNINETEYFEIIRQKTASLVAACCAVGVASVSDSSEVEIEKWRLIGEKIGIAFQIKDDLFDYGNAQIGKPVGIDIKEKKMTLPLIYALVHADKNTKQRIIYDIKNNSHKNSKVREIIAFVQASGGMTYATEKMMQYVSEAKSEITILPDSEYKTALLQLIDYTIERNN